MTNKTNQKQTKRRFRSTYNYIPLESDTEVNNEPSQTISGQAFSIREILTKWTRGVPPEISKLGYYNENEDPSFDDYDETRNPGFDLADASETLYSLKLKSQRQEQTQTTKQKQPNDITGNKQLKKEEMQRSGIDENSTEKLPVE